MNNGSVQKKYFWRMLSSMLLFVQFVSLSLFALPALAAAPTNIISYQGRLLNSNRAPVSDTSASIIFELYTLVSGGSCVWSNSSATCASATARTVTLTDGLFSENLGDTAAGVPYAAIGDAIFGDNSTLFLQITINSEVLTPRKQIAAAPYALNAQMLDGLDSDTDGATATALIAYNSSGNLVVTGNPSGSGVSAGSVYINPASANTSTNDTLFGVALEGTSRFRVDAEGDVTVLGDLAANDFACTDCLGFTELGDSLSVDSDTQWNLGTASLTINMDDTGDFVIRDAGSDLFRFQDSGVLNITPYNTTQAGAVFNFSTSTTGRGVSVVSQDNATDYDGSLLYISQENTSLTSDATALQVAQSGGGNATGLYITQGQVGNATTSPTAQALVIDVNEAANNDEVILIRSDASGGGVDTEFRFENDGDFFGDGATYNSGADYAEFFSTADTTLGDYEVVCWNAEQANGVRRCEPGNTNIVGIISTNPGFVGNNLVGAEGNLENNSSYALVGLVGQIETNVSADAGAINIGDALTTSSSLAGYAAKAGGGTYIIGRALEALSSGTGTIKVLVQPMWYGGDMLTMNGEATMFTGDIVLGGAKATAADVSVDSAGLSFVGSVWNGSLASDVSLSIRNNVLGNGNARLSLQNDDGVDVMTFGSTGDLALAGNFYPSDRGALQYGAYVYYDSTDAGYMSTNAAGWSSNSSNFAESFVSADSLVPGDVVEFAVDGSGVMRSSGETYSNRIAGVVSSQSAFVAGSSVGTYPIAVSGRVSTKVSDENGAIAPGDALTTSTRAGFAMKATSSGQIIGYALESWVSGEGNILAFVRPQYAYAGNSPAPSSLAVSSRDIEHLNVSGVLSMNGGDIVSVGTLSGIGTWEIRENGDIVTNGQLTQVVESLQNTRVSTYATTSTETIVQLSGTSTLHNGMARVQFEDIDQNYNDIISLDDTYRVLVTPDGITGQLYVTDRTNVGFIIRDSDGGEGVSVDWLVLAYRYDLVPEERGNTDVTDGETDSTHDVTESEEDLPAEESELLDEELVDVEGNEEVPLVEEDDDVTEPEDAFPVQEDESANGEVGEEIVTPVPEETSEPPETSLENTP